MRGYGTLQTMTALETLVDEAATELGMDPIELRRRNLLRTGGLTMNGNPWTVSVRTPELLDKLEAHPIWRDRAAEKASAADGVLIGTGVACCVKDYGTGADSSRARVTLDPDGSISIHSDSVEMGNGIGTAMANRVALVLGRVADEVTLAELDQFDELGLVTEGDGRSMSQEEQDRLSKNPRWVPDISSATSASNGAHVGTQPAAQVARVIFRYGMWPAALELWGIPETDPRRFLWEEAFWQDNELILSGLPPLSQAEIAAKAHEQKGITGAIGHAFSRWAWAQAAFPLGDGDDWAAEIDALAVRRGDGPFAVVDRSFVAYPPTDLQPDRHLVRRRLRDGAEGRDRQEERARSASPRRTTSSSVARRSLRKSSAAWLRADSPWAWATRSSNTCRPSRTVPATASGTSASISSPAPRICRCDRLETEILPPVSPKEPPKGMAEVVMIPVVSALLNAIFDATGKRFYSLPVTPSMLQGAIS